MTHATTNNLPATANPRAWALVALVNRNPAWWASAGAAVGLFSDLEESEPHFHVPSSWAWTVAANSNNEQVSNLSFMTLTRTSGICGWESSGHQLKQLKLMFQKSPVDCCTWSGFRASFSAFERSSHRLQVPPTRAPRPLWLSRFKFSPPKNSWRKLGHPSALASPGESGRQTLKRTRCADRTKPADQKGK